MAMVALWVGLDVGDYHTHICVIDEYGTVQLETSVETQPSNIASTLSDFPRHSIKKIVMEAGLPCSMICRHLRALSYPAAIFDARRIARILSLSGSKTDKNDARGIAQIARVAESALKEVHVKTPDIERLRGELVLRDSLVRQRVAAETAMRNTFRVYGVKLKSTSSSAVLRARVSEALKSLGDHGIALGGQVTPLLDLCCSLRSCVASMDLRLKAIAQKNEVTRRFMEIPAVGPICALSFYTAVGEPDRFARSKDIAAYLGLAPRVRQSGNSSRLGRVTGYGNKLTRSHLVMAARSLNRKNTIALSDLRTWGEGVMERSGSSKARVAIARKLATIMLAMWRDGRSFQPFREADQM
ncbi:IS110 family transposase [Sphingobium yanoikuyae]|nr:IS110 family transposase [Sphingobium yanoikuyae]